MQWAPILIAGFQATGTALSGQATDAALVAKSKTATINQKYATQDSVQELRTAALEESRIRREGREAVADQFAAFAQSGFEPTGFSVESSLSESATNAEMDALNVRYGGELRSRNKAIEAENYRIEAKNALEARKSNRTSTLIGSATQLLSGAAKAYGVKV